MSNNPSFIVTRRTEDRIKQINVPLGFLVAFALVALSGIILLGVMVYGYHDLRDSIADNGQMALTVAKQREKIVDQRLQIQTFAHEIDALKNKLLSLEQFEEKIRSIANLDPIGDDAGLFGVGGAAVEDLDPALGLARRHEALMREMHRQVKEMNAVTLDQQDRFESLLETLSEQRSALESTPSIKPSDGWISSRFGYRVSPFTERRELHKGIDIANHTGTPIHATAGGKIAFAGNKGAMGKVMKIDHGNGLVTRYAHLSKILKEKGASVKRGDIIALMGSTGRSTGPHVHYEVRLNGAAVDPAKYILD